MKNELLCIGPASLTFICPNCCELKAHTDKKLKGKVSYNTHTHNNVEKFSQITINTYNISLSLSVVYMCKTKIINEWLLKSIRACIFQIQTYLFIK